MKNKSFSIIYSYEYISARPRMNKALTKNIKYFIDEVSKTADDNIFDLIKEMYGTVELDSTLYKLLYKIIDREYLSINEDSDFNFYIYPDSVSVYHCYNGKVHLSTSDSIYGDYSKIYSNMNKDAIKEAFRSLEEIAENQNAESDNIDLLFVNNVIFEKGIPISIYKQRSK